MGPGVGGLGCSGRSGVDFAGGFVVVRSCQVLLDRNVFKADLGFHCACDLHRSCHVVAFGLLNFCFLFLVVSFVYVICAGFDTALGGWARHDAAGSPDAACV